MPIYFYIKLLHSLLFFLIVICAVYLCYTILAGHITSLSWTAFTVMSLEFLVLLLNDWQCPLTTYAESKGASSGSVADLFLPRWISDRLFRIYGCVFVLLSVLLIWRSIGP